MALIEDATSQKYLNVYSAKGIYFLRVHVTLVSILLNFHSSADFGQQINLSFTAVFFFF